MLVARDTVVSLRVEMHDAHGVQLQPASDLTYLHGGYGELFESLERVLEGKAPGESVRLQLEPEPTSRRARWCSTAIIRSPEWPCGSRLK